MHGKGETIFIITISATSNFTSRIMETFLSRFDIKITSSRNVFRYIKETNIRGCIYKLANKKSYVQLRRIKHFNQGKVRGSIFFSFNP